MDESSEIPKESKYQEANEFSRWFFLWMISLFKTGSKEEIDFKHISSCPDDDGPEKVTLKLENEWAVEIKKSQRANSKYSPSLVKAIARAFGVKFILANILVLIGEIVRLAQPFMIGVIVHNLSTGSRGPDEDPKVKRLVDFSAAAFVISSVINVVTRHRGNILLTRIGNKVRTAITMMVYKKILLTSSSSLSEGGTNIGNIMNILANDLNRFEELSWVLIFIVLGPSMGIFVMYVTWIFLGIAFLGGLIMLIIFIIFQAFMSRYFNKFRSSTAKVTDVRVKSMSELISAIKLIKVYCWEKPYAEQIDTIRRQEIVKLKGTYILKGINSSLFFIATRIMLFAAFIWRVLSGEKLTEVALFITMPLYDAIRISVTHSFSYAIGVGAETLIACDRIEKVLLMKEKSKAKVKLTASKSNNNSIGIGNGKVIGTMIANCAFVESAVKLNKYFGKWTSSVPHNNLANVTFSIERGELVIVIGPIGSGKSCLLNALLGEIETTSGDLTVKGSISYAPQEAWVFGGTVKTNVLLGQEKSYNEERYSKILEVCNLTRDLTLMPDYDETFVGEKGYSLSGGQKARLSLARCVYNEKAEVYLFDDPLSAVDPKVANSIFSEVMVKFLSDKTRILVTHQLQFLPRADKILLLNNGSVDFYGTYDQLLHSNIDIGSIVSDQNERKSDLKRQNSCTDDTRSVLSQRSRRSSTIDSIPLEQNETEMTELDEEPVRQQVNREEERKVGRLDPKVYWKYLTAGDHRSFLVLSFLFSLASQGMYQLNDTWLSAWAGQFDLQSSVHESNNSTEVTDQPKSLGSKLVTNSLDGNIAIYSALTVVLFIFGFSRTLFTFLMCLSSSIKLHDTIFKKLLRAPMSFYENNSLGRILNRVTRDIGIIDQNIPNSICDLQLCINQVLGVVVLCFFVNYWLIIPVVVLGLISWPIRGIYISSARALQRLDSLARSPVYNSVSSTLSGLIVIRSYDGLTGKLLNQFSSQVKDSVSCRFHVLCSQRAVGLALDLITNVYVMAIVIVVMTTNISPADAGLILASSTQLMGFFNYCVRATADLETQMISCERVLEYSNLPSEAELIVHNNELPANWPSSGGIEFKSVNLWYDKSLPPVLKSISFAVLPGQKIGIVGRTGAGKSSLISVLFRLVEPEGAILIDKINITQIGLHQLRNKISIIPQDPTLFSGTVRSNLDPFNKYKDDQMWQVLRLSNLFDAVSAMKGGLDAVILEGGSNLSVGQRQLLCLARALLKRNSILICDEATANVDQVTDELIQETIKGEFKECTVLTIAHRLNTIIDMDKVLVMDAGKVVEFDEPYILLQNTSGFFYSMVKQTGPQFEKSLHSLAKKAHQERVKESAEDADATD